MKRKTRIVVFTALALGVSMAVSSTNAHRRKPTGGDLAVPTHLRPIITRACRDCHTDQTQWPWYSRLPLLSLLIERDVQKGREHVNFSTWASPLRESQRATNCRKSATRFPTTPCHHAPTGSCTRKPDSRYKMSMHFAIGRIWQTA